MTTERKEPVTDWAKDYDIFDPSYVKDPYPVWDELRGKCPVAHTGRWGGSWMPTRFEDVFAIAQDIQHFSSREILVAPTIPVPGTTDPSSPNYGIGAAPIASDPPVHTWSRRLILPSFSMRSTEQYVEHTRKLCRSLIDGFIEEGRADAAVDYAQQIPPRVIAMLLGIPQEMSATFTNWVRDLLEVGPHGVHPGPGALLLNDQNPFRFEQSAVLSAPQDECRSRRGFSDKFGTAGIQSRVFGGSRGLWLQS
jgi:cytochrome P450